jgi:hypothetical protein
MKRLGLVPGALLGLVVGSLVAADPLPVAGPISPDQLRRHGRDVLAAFNKLQCPPPAATTKELKALFDGKEEEPTEFSVPVQKLLDAHCLIGVSINPEGQVKAARGPAEAVLREGADTAFLVKVDNDAGITHPVSVSGPQRVTAGDKNEDRWLAAAVVAPAPLRKELSGGRGWSTCCCGFGRARPASARRPCASTWARGARTSASAPRCRSCSRSNPRRADGGRASEQTAEG